jgi:UDP-N-acetylglucosamine transferase subunit ALG13
MQLRDSLSAFRRVWITTPGEKATRIRETGDRVLLVPPLDRRNLSLSNPPRSLRLAFGERPRVVLTSGAGVVGSFVIGARALGARVLFVETMARVRSGSATGRALAPLSDEFFVQWPDLMNVYSRARLCKPLLLSNIANESDRTGEGTFVAVGSHTQPFDRLLRAVARAAASGLLPGPVRVQTGASAFEAPHLETHRWISEGRFAAFLGSARYVICHGGASVMAQALRASRRPLVMSRDRARGEHVDDHQAELLAELERRELVVRVEDEICAEHLDAADRPWPREQAWDGLPDLRDVVPLAVDGRR